MHLFRLVACKCGRGIRSALPLSLTPNLVFKERHQGSSPNPSFAMKTCQVHRISAVALASAHAFALQYFQSIISFNIDLIAIGKSMLGQIQRSKYPQIGIRG
jgi:hypothetical protein